MLDIVSGEGMQEALGNPFVVVVDRGDVERSDISATYAVLKRLLESAEIARAYREKVDIAFHGYDADRRKLFEIPEVRHFVTELDKEFPFWLFFLTRESTGLQAIASCFLPPYLTTEAERQIWPQRLQELIEQRWGPALAHLASHTGLVEQEVRRMLADSAHYFLEGPRLGSDLGSG